MVLSGATEIDSQRAAINFLSDECFLALNGTLNINKVSWCKTSWPTSASINGNTNVNDILNILEKFVEISIRHLKGKVANEECLGWGVLPGFSSRFVLVVNHETAAFQDGLVFGFD